MNAAMANVSKSALEAKQMGYLRPTDTIVFNSHELLWTAIGEAARCTHAGYRRAAASRSVSGRRPLRAWPPSRRSWSTCATAASSSRTIIHLARGIADVMCGGDVESTGALVDEQWLLDLERKFFMRACRIIRRRRSASWA